MADNQNSVTDREEFAKTQPYPNLNDVDKIAASFGVEKPDEEPLQMKQKLERRDEERFLLDPDSAENTK